MLQFCKGLFPSVRYAFTTIPTYPSGQIGFVVCGKSEKAKLNKAKRSVKAALGKKTAKVCCECFGVICLWLTGAWLCAFVQTLHYYNTEIHGAAFVLPQFVSAELPK